jgi:hypothetical protein
MLWAVSHLLSQGQEHWPHTGCQLLKMSMGLWNVASSGQSVFLSVLCLLRWILTSPWLMRRIIRLCLYGLLFCSLWLLCGTASCLHHQRRPSLGSSFAHWATFYSIVALLFQNYLQFQGLLCWQFVMPALLWLLC